MEGSGIAMRKEGKKERMYRKKEGKEEGKGTVEDEGSM